MKNVYKLNYSSKIKGLGNSYSSIIRRETLNNMIIIGIKNIVQKLQHNFHQSFDENKCFMTYMIIYDTYFTAYKVWIVERLFVVGNVCFMSYSQKAKHCENFRIIN